ncbi:thermonuclease family protein [Domibacillus epiphyticus]|uniref:TNase-like domain-containing protein n=1 Tax=Domibacillus epiphyticus TaxID=1714355 RepID=A0A1V2A5M0_9BACI|nr:thermonuclease family protein [Domibacillus epiphyticus]OMP66162.1 hypothetical protein BTO28_13655 [Domibacillus epiphyticus]
MDKIGEDQYGRILAYLYINDGMFNKKLLDNGLARIAIYPPNTQYLEELQAAEAAANKKKAGIWSNPNAQWRVRSRNTSSKTKASSHRRTKHSKAVQSCVKRSQMGLKKDIRI